MNKKELALRVQEKATIKGASVPREDVKNILDVLFDPKAGVIIDCLNGDGEIQIPKFGKFRLFERPARQGRDPRTGESVLLKAKRTVKFKPSASLERMLSK